MIRVSKTHYYAYLTCIYCSHNDSLPAIGHSGENCPKKFPQLDKKYEHLCSGKFICEDNHSENFSKILQNLQNLFKMTQHFFFISSKYWPCNWSIMGSSVCTTSGDNVETQTLTVHMYERLAKLHCPYFLICTTVALVSGNARSMLPKAVYTLANTMFT